MTLAILLNLMTIRLYLLFWALIFTVSAAVALPQVITDPSGTVVVMGIEPPRYVYHWVDYDTLAKIAKDKKFSEPWDRFGDLSRSNFNAFWSQFKSKDFGGLFAWTHPVLGMKGGPNENYGEALIRIELDVEKIKAMQVTTADKPYDFSTPLDVSDVDLVLHDKSHHFKEWVLLNPGIIKNFTADVDVLLPTLQEELRRLKDPSHMYSSDEVHFSNFKAKGYEDHLSYAIRTITDLIESNRDAIPSYFRRDEKGNAVFAKWITGSRALRTTILTEALRRFKKNHPQKQISPESVRAALMKIDTGVIAVGAAYESELDLRIRQYIYENPSSDSLKEIADLLPLLNFWQHTFVSEVNQKVSARLRETPFDPFRSILDILFLSDSPFRNSDSLADRKLDYILQTVAKSDHADSFRAAYERSFLGNEFNFQGRGERLAALIRRASVRSCQMLFAN